MPFDGSGNFSRLYNWVADRDAGIRILASKMDGEFNNVSAGMNVVFFRNGLVPMSGNLAMGQNYITGLGAGALGALSMRFGDDPNSGLYLNGIGRPTVVANGVAAAEFNSLGFTTPLLARIMGTATPTSGVGVEISYSGLGGTMSAYDRSAAAYKPMDIYGLPITLRAGATPVAVVSGTGLTVTGAISANTAPSAGVSLHLGGTAPTIRLGGGGATDWVHFGRDGTSGGAYAYTPGAQPFTVFTNTQQRFQIDSAGNAYFTGTLSLNGNTVATNAGVAGSYFPLSGGASITGNVTFNNGVSIPLGLGVASGGTGGTTQASARTGLDVYSTAQVDSGLNARLALTGGGMTGNITTSANFYVANTGGTFGNVTGGFGWQVFANSGTLVGLVNNVARITVNANGLGVNTTAVSGVDIHAGGGTIRAGGSGASDWVHFGRDGATGDSYCYSPANGFRVYTGGTVRMTLDTAGNLVASGNITASSDRRNKMAIQPLEGSLDAVLSMQGVKYIDRATGQARIGVIAQDMELVRSEYVNTDKDGFKSVAYGNIVADLIEAVKVLTARVAELEGSR